MKRPLGSPSTWLRKFYRGLDAGSVDVPCGDCTVCCRSFEFIVLADSEKDKYNHHLLDDGRPVLDMTEEGHCGYLTETGCSVYEDRPLNCRQFDCRSLAHCGLFPEDYPELSIIVKNWEVELKTEEDKVLSMALRMASREAVSQGKDALAAMTYAVIGGYGKYAKDAVKIVRQHEKNPIGLVDSKGKLL